MEKKYSAPAVARLFDIIELMAAENRGFSINEIARLLDYPVNTVYRICKEMEERTYLEKNASDGLYYIGGRFFTIGQIAGSRIELRSRALPFMKTLRSELDETVHLTVLRSNWMVLLDQVETKQPVRIYVETGSLLYPHASAFGKCLLAYCDNEFLEDYIKDIPSPLTANTIVDAEKLYVELKTIRSTGYAWDMEEYLEGVRCVGAPVHSLMGEGIAAIGVMAPAYRFEHEKMEQAAQLVMEAAHELSTAMGYDFNA